MITLYTHYTVSNYSYWPKSSNSQCVISAVTLVWHWQIWSEVNTLWYFVLTLKRHHRHHKQSDSVVSPSHSPQCSHGLTFSFSWCFPSGQLNTERASETWGCVQGHCFLMSNVADQLFSWEAKTISYCYSKVISTVFVCFNATVIISWMALCCIV